MDTLRIVLRDIFSIPLLGGFVALIIGLFPLLALVPFYGSINNFLLNTAGGLIVAGWCFILGKLRIANLILLGILGLAVAAMGAYQYLFPPNYLSS